MSGIDSFTKLYLPLNNDSIDYEITPKTVSNTAVTFSNTVYPFSGGGYMGSFNGTSSFLRVATSADFNPGSSDFTVDFWVKQLRNSPDVDDLFVIDSADSHAVGNYGIEIFITGAGKPGFAYSNGTTDWTVNSGTSIVNSLVHLAAVRSGNTTSLFIDGSSVGTPQTVSGSMRFNSSVLTVGKRFTTEFAQATIGQVRWSNGIARWTSNFTPPTSPYTLDGGVLSTMRSVW